MLKPVSPKAGQCYERALQAHERADAAINSVARDGYLASETRWLKLALRLLRMCHVWPCHRTTEKRDELASSHAPFR